MTRKLILFNGPPRSGKDLACEYLYSEYPEAYWFRMSQPLKQAVLAIFGWGPSMESTLERIKDTPTEALLGLSYRQWQIFLSEEVLKPKFGKDVFGNLAVRRIASSYAQLLLCSDAGFSDEIEPIAKLIKPENILLMQLHRHGCSFANDSRNYIDIPGATKVTLHNDGDPATYKHLVLTVVKEWLYPSQS